MTTPSNLPRKELGCTSLLAHAPLNSHAPLNLHAHLSLHAPQLACTLRHPREVATLKNTNVGMTQSLQRRPTASHERRSTVFDLLDARTSRTELRLRMDLDRRRMRLDRQPLDRRHVVAAGGAACIGACIALGGGGGDGGAHRCDLDELCGCGIPLAVQDRTDDARTDEQHGTW